MSKNITCYVVTDADRQIAKQLDSPAFSPYSIATLRGMYDDTHEDKIDTLNIEEAARKVASYRYSLVKQHDQEYKSMGSNKVSSYAKLKEKFTPLERNDRVNMICALFSAKVDDIIAHNPNFTRDEIINGFDSDRGRKGGAFAIFESVYKDIAEMVSMYAAMPNGTGAIKAEKLLQILDNWDSIVTYARIKLRDTESVKLGNTSDFCDDAELDNYLDSYISEVLNVEEMKREGWQDINDQRKAFGSIGKLVRRLLGNMPRYIVNEDGQVVQDVDDVLGLPRTLDPVRAHQQLLEILRGMANSEDMINILKQAEKDGEVWLTPLISHFQAQPNDISMFYRDLKKNMQLFSTIERDKNGNYKTTVLNKTRDRLTTAMKARISAGKMLNATSVYDELGNVNWRNLKSVRDTIVDMLDEPTVNGQKVYGKGGSKFFSEGQTRLSRREFLVNTSRSLGIDLTAEDAEALLSNKSELNEYLRNLRDIVKYGIEPAYGKGLELVKKGESPEQRRYSVKNMKNKTGMFLEKVEKMNTVITKLRGRLQIDSRCTKRDSRGNIKVFYSNINPCYMGDSLEYITRMIESDNKEGLKSYIEKKYLRSSYFYDTYKAKKKENYNPDKFYPDCIFNRWIKDLYVACLDDKKKSLSESVVANCFTYQRMLGTPDVNFEDFTSQQHAVDMLQEYWSDSVLHSKWGTALFPVFILGDSGVQKYIRQKVYSESEIIDGMYQVYLQELNRDNQIDALNTFLEEKGKRETGKAYKGVNNFSNSKGEFTYLKFFNGNYEAEVVKNGVITKQKGKYALSENPAEEEGKAKIREYMQDAYFVYKQRLQDLGVLTLDKNGNYEHLRQFTSPKTADDAHNDYSLAKAFYNLKFATIEQLQMFTIDPAFYGKEKTVDGKTVVVNRVKDLQKRYKEQHAPGTKLDVLRMGEEDRYETCVYFDDIENGFEDVDAEYARCLKNAFGEQSDVYQTYKKGMTLTDGQGYRTLTSYRKVMIMHGEWDVNGEEERVYNRIMELRAEYGHNQIPAEELTWLKEHASVIFKPLKPYMFTFEHIDTGSDIITVPVQHKYAEVVLIPELLPQDSKLRDMAFWMEEHTDDQNRPQPIDMVCSTTVVKVGAFGSTDIQSLESYDSEIMSKTGMKKEEITNTQRLNHALSLAYIHKLSYEDYRVQTNVPDHVHQSQLFGTQVRKLIMSGVLKYDKNGKLVDNKDKNGFYRYEKYVDYNFVNLGGKKGKVRLNSRNLISFYNNLIVANILDSFHQFEKVIKDPEMLSNMMIQNIIGNSRESIDNIFAFTMSDDDFNLALFEGGIEHDTAAFLLSVYKKLVNKQKINGGSGVQASAMGISDYSKDGGLKYIYDYAKNEDGSFKLDEDGNKIPTNILYAECEIPFNFTYTDKDGNIVELNYDEYCNNDGTLKKNKDGKILLDIDFPGMRDMVAYRIPTERDYSMINLRAVRFSRKVAGGTIKVPAPETTKAGFDFDIDKLYFMRKEFNLKEGFNWKEFKKAAKKEFPNLSKDDIDIITDEIKNGKIAFSENTPEMQMFDFYTEHKNEFIKKSFSSDYDYEKTPLENTREARNNMLLRLIQERLMDEETFEQRMTPGGFRGASKSARMHRELQFGKLEGIVINGLVDFNALEQRATDKSVADPEPEYDYTDPMTMVVYNQQNQVAAKLIGIFANQNTNHALAKLLSQFSIKKGYRIAFADHSESDGYGFDLLHGPKGVNVDLNLAEFLAASVDAVKDPVLNFLNFNTLTANSGALLARIGYSTFEIGLLFDQPIIKEVCNTAFSKNESLNDAIIDVKKKYSELFSFTDNDMNLMQSDVSKEALAKGIIGFRKDIHISEKDRSFARQQMSVLTLFEQISNVADQVNNFVMSTKFTASNSVHSTFGDMYAQQLKVDNYVSSIDSQESVLDIKLSDLSNDNIPMKNNSEFVDMSDEDYMNTMSDNPLAYEQAMFDMNRRMLKAFAKYFPYETAMYKTARDFALSLTRSHYLDGETINEIHRDIVAFMLAQNENSKFNGNYILYTDHGELSAKTYFNNYFAQDLLIYLEEHPELKEMAIFQYMEFSELGEEETDEFGQPIESSRPLALNINGIGGLQPYQIEEIKESWEELQKIDPQLAENLFFYNFHKKGFDFSPLTFMNLAPVSVKKAIKLQVEDFNPATNKYEPYVMSYDTFLKQLLNGRSYGGNNVVWRAMDNIEFMKQFIANHQDNKYLIYSVKNNKAANIIRPLMFEASAAVDEFTLDLSTKTEQEKGMFLLSSTKDYDLFVPAIELDGNLYIASGTSFNQSYDKQMTYKRIDASSKYTKTFVAAKQNSSEPSTSIDTEVDTANGIKQSQERFDMIDFIADSFASVASDYASFVNPETNKPFSKELFKKMFSDDSEQSLKNTIEQIKESVKNFGVLTFNIDDKGNVTSIKMC